MVNILVGGLPQ